MRRAPNFWHSSGRGWRSVILSPLAFIWRKATERRLRRTGYRARIPVICIGNVTIGGAGKTPTVIAVVKALGARGYRPVVLLRGYGRATQDARQVMDMDMAMAVGDEALLHARYAPTVVAVNRAEGAQLAETLGNIIVMDDGLQNPQLEKDVSVLAIDGTLGFGNGAIIPAGPLREPVANVIKRIDCILLLGDSDFSRLDKLPIFRGEMKPLAAQNLADQKVVAFAGIARPEKFYQTLHDMGADIVATRDFGDHAHIPDQALDELTQQAREQGATLVTTEKDFVRLDGNRRTEVQAIGIELEISEGFYDFIENRLPRT